MNHQGLRWNVHCVANVGLRIRLNLYKRGFKIYDLLVFSSFCLRLDADRHSAVLTIGVNHGTCYVFRYPGPRGFLLYYLFYLEICDAKR